jgi:2-polyprenyl-6-methoxyphenol hydroxylase-like FAD-dependent oxidoreductase
MTDPQVLVGGGGPVGLTLAIDLGLRGVRCTLIEQKAAPQFLPKMARCNARTMEIFRRMGIAERVRAAGLRADVPMDVFIGCGNRAPEDAGEVAGIATGARSARLGVQP